MVNIFFRNPVITQLRFYENFKIRCKDNTKVNNVFLQSAKKMKKSAFFSILVFFVITGLRYYDTL